MRELKTYGSQTFKIGRQTRTTVTARTQRDARSFLSIAGIHVSMNEWKNFWTETGNKTEIANTGDVEGRVIVYDASIISDTVALQIDTLEAKETS